MRVLFLHRLVAVTSNGDAFFVQPLGNRSRMMPVCELQEIGEAQCSLDA